RQACPRLRRPAVRTWMFSALAQLSLGDEGFPSQWICFPLTPNFPGGNSHARCRANCVVSIARTAQEANELRRYWLRGDVVACAGAEARAGAARRDLRAAA